MLEVSALNDSRNEGERAFELVLEDMRLQAFRIYESVRAAQRGADGDVALQMRDLRVAAWRAAELSEQIAALHCAVDADTLAHDVESIAF